MPDRNPSIVLTGFGASSAGARQVYSHIEQHIRLAKPAHDIRWAFTSSRIVARLREQGTVLPTLDEALSKLGRDSVAAAVLLPLLTVPGQEYAKILAKAAATSRWRAARPLLDTLESVDEVCAALAPAFERDAVNVVVCHGNDNYPEYNCLLLELAAALESRHANVVVASIEGSPGHGPLDRARLLVRDTGWVHFVPFMLVAGEHITEDVLGDGERSWKSRIVAGRTTCAPPLGNNPSILDLYLRRLDQALEQIASPCR